MANEFYMKKGDTAPSIETILSSAGNPVNLDGCTVLFRMSPAGTGNPLLERAATVVMPQTGADIGKVYFEWEDGDTDTTGTHDAEWRVTFTNGKKATFPRGSGEMFNKVIIQSEVV